MPNSTPYVGPMDQTRLMSLVEAMTSITLGLCFGVLLRWVILPKFSVALENVDSMWWLLAFSAFAVFRTYVVRRIFERMR